MRYPLSLLVLLALLLSSCSAIKAIEPAVPTATSPAPATETAEAAASEEAETAPETTASTEAASSTPVPDPSETPSQAVPALPGAATDSNPPVGQDLSRTDAQGAVEVDVTPSNLANPGETLTFEVGLYTHSVNLNMDLAALSTLKTDTGLSVNASAWNGDSGGHHVFGSLAFPVRVNGKALLAGAKVLTLVIKNVDAPERTFTWDLKP